MNAISVRLGNLNRCMPVWNGDLLVGLSVELNAGLRPSMRGEVLAHELIHVCQFLSGAVRPGAAFSRSESDESWAYNGSERWYALWQEAFDSRVEELWANGVVTLSVTDTLKAQFVKEWNILFVGEFGPLPNWS